ncbi:hypothetical protein CQ020_09660, partial [Arthrobacter sp. MYb23]
MLHVLMATSVHLWMLRRNSIVFHLTLMDVFGVYVTVRRLSVTDPHVLNHRLLCGKMLTGTVLTGFAVLPRHVLLRHVRLMHVRLMGVLKVAFGLAVLFIHVECGLISTIGRHLGLCRRCCGCGGRCGRGGCHGCGRRH